MDIYILFLSFSDWREQSSKLVSGRDPVMYVSLSIFLHIRKIKGAVMQFNLHLQSYNYTFKFVYCRPQQ